MESDTVSAAIRNPY